MFARKYDCAGSGLEKEGPDVEKYFVCHSHPDPKIAMKTDRPDVARCMTFFKENASSEQDPARKIEYIAAMAEDKELLSDLNKTPDACPDDTTVIMYDDYDPCCTIS